MYDTLSRYQVGHEIEVRPGIVSKDTEGKLTCKPIFSKIVSLFAEQNDLQYGVPGGLIGKSLGGLVHTSLDVSGGLFHKSLDVSGGLFHKSLDVSGGLFHKSLDVSGGLFHKSLDVSGGLFHKSLDVSGGLFHKSVGVSGELIGVSGGTDW